MLSIPEFLPELEILLPEASEILRAANLTVHDAVRQVTLEGSRGLAGGFRPDSDIDLTLIVDAAQLPPPRRSARSFYVTRCGSPSITGARRSTSIWRRCSTRAAAAACAASTSGIGTTR
ncbi:MAG: hypothetical protein U0521_05640 [Anaerolineae bacterium]